MTTEDYGTTSEMDQSTRYLATGTIRSLITSLLLMEASTELKELALSMQD